MSKSDKSVNELIKSEYKHGFVTDIESDTFEPGLNENIVRRIYARKNEPEWMLEGRLKAYRAWCEMETQGWAHVKFPVIDFDAISYYSAPKSQENVPKSLDEVCLGRLMDKYENIQKAICVKEINV